MLENVFYILLYKPHHPRVQIGAVLLTPVKLSQLRVWLDEISQCCSPKEQDSQPGGSRSFSPPAELTLRSGLFSALSSLSKEKQLLGKTFSPYSDS